MRLDPQQAKAAAGIALIAAASLLWPLFGNPPYGYYGLMKWVVAGGSAYSAWMVYQVSRSWAPLSFLLVASGGIELLGKMRRYEWVPFNWASVVLLLVAAVVLFRASMESKNETE